jgi:hypothetical protein
MSSVSSTGSTSYYYSVQKKAFDKLDADQNGSLSEREYQAGQPKNAGKDKLAESYDALDTDASAGVSLDEYVGGMSSGSGSGLLGQLSSGALDVLMQLRPQDGGGADDASAATNSPRLSVPSVAPATAAGDMALAAHETGASSALRLFDLLDVEAADKAAQ